MLLDIGVGIMLGLVWDINFSDLTLLTNIMFGVFAALSPDLDFLLHISKGGTTRNAHRHRELLHVPFLFISGGSILTFIVEPQLAGLFAIGAASHMIHDSIGIGWGVQWLFPFSKRHFAFGYRVRTGIHAKLPKQSYYVWENDDMEQLTKKYGDPDWFKNTYLKWHPFAIFELAVFVIAILTLVWYLNK